LQNWGWLDQHDVEGVLGILDELRLRRSVSPAMAQAEAEHQQYFEVVSAVLGTHEPDGEYGREALHKLDAAHGDCMNLYEERGFRLGLAVAAALRDTEELVEAAPVAHGSTVAPATVEPPEAPSQADDESDAGSEPELSDAARRISSIAAAADGLRQVLAQGDLLDDNPRLEVLVSEAARCLDQVAEGRGGAEASAPPLAPPADQEGDEISPERRRVRLVLRNSQELQEALSDLSRDIAEVSLDLDETMTLVLTRGVGRAALRARDLATYASS